MRALTWQGNLDVQVTDVPDPRIQEGAALFGYTSLYGSVPGGQAQFLRVPQAQFGPIKVPADGPDEQYLFLSDVLPTAYQAVAYADTPKDGTLAVLGLGPVGQFSARIARHLGVERVIEMTAGRGPDAIIDAVGMEAHGHDEAGGNKLATVSVSGVYGGEADPMPSPRSRRAGCHRTRRAGRPGPDRSRPHPPTSARRG